MAELLASRQGGVTIVEFAAKEVLDIATSRSIGEQLSAIVDQKVDHNLLIDFGRVRLITSSMIGVLLQIHKKCQDAKVELKLCNFSKELADLFKKLKLHSVFDIYSSRFDAVKAFTIAK